MSESGLEVEGRLAGELTLLCLPGSSRQSGSGTYARAWR